MEWNIFCFPTHFFVSSLFGSLFWARHRSSHKFPWTATIVNRARVSIEKWQTMSCESHCKRVEIAIYPSPVTVQPFKWKWKAKLFENKSEGECGKVDEGMKENKVRISERKSIDFVLFVWMRRTRQWKNYSQNICAIFRFCCQQQLPSLCACASGADPNTNIYRLPLLSIR